MRKFILVLAVFAAVLPACSTGNDGPQRYVVDVDGKSTAKEKFQFSAFFPAAIKVSGGDAIKFRNRATEAPHTITFGVLPDRSNSPPVLTPDGENPVVLQPCDIDAAPTPKLVKCSEDELRPFDGTGYWNSGFLNPAPAPKSAGPKNVTVKFADDTPAGDYTYVCILHPFMNGTVQVVEDRADRSAIDDVRKALKEDAAAVRETAEDLEEPELEIDGDDATIAAGWGDKVTSVNRFGPASVEVDAGTTVHWEAKNPYEPHIVTFESTFEQPLPAEGFVPGGLPSGSDYTDGFSSSGIFGAEGTPFEGSFSLTFPEAGTYEYTCPLHPGMDGTVKVT